MGKLVHVLLAISLFLTGCGDVLSDKNSYEACRYEVAQDLDKGNYDEVIDSDCADLLQLGAAYFGRAGFDTSRVINILSEASNYDDALVLFMGDLIGIITEQVLSDLNESKGMYQSVPLTSEHYRDAQFYLALVQAMNGLSLIKKVIDSDGDGLYIDCDVGVTDIALQATAQQGCGGLLCTWPATDITFSGAGRPGTYRVLQATSSFALCTTTENKLLYFDAWTGTYRVVVTSGTCVADNGNTLPCPMIVNGEPLGLVSAFDVAITDSIRGLEIAIDFGIDSDVVDELRGIRNDACGGDTCLESEIANYISTLVN